MDDEYEPQRFDPIAFTFPDGAGGPVIEETVAEVRMPSRNDTDLARVLRDLGEPTRDMTVRDYPYLFSGVDSSAEWIPPRVYERITVNARLRYSLGPAPPIATPSARTCELYGALLRMEEVHGMACRMLASKSEPIQVGSWIVGRTGFAIRMPSGEWSAGTTVMRLLGLDCARKRFAAHFIAEQGLVEDGSPELADLCAELFAIHDAALVSGGNMGYGVVKATEGVFKGHAMRLARCEVAQFSGIDRALATVRVRQTPAYDAATSYQRLADKTRTVRDAIELFGLQKASGYPMVSQIASAASTQRYGKTPLHTQPESCEDLGHAFASQFLSGYLRKHNQWPPFASPPRDGTRLAEYFEARSLIVPPGSYPLSDWEGVRFSKCFSVDERVDSLETLDDKTCAAPEIATISTKGMDEGLVSRSVLRHALCAPRVPVRSILEQIKARDLDLSIRMCELSLKGGEMKPHTGRLFAMFTYPLREALSVAERALMRDIQPLFPEAVKAMTPSELSRDLCQLSTMEGVFTEGDLERWNLNWDENNTMGPAGHLDDIYGENGAGGLWSSVHHAFFQCILFMKPVTGFPANVTRGSELPDGPLTHRGHNKGLEGQFQTFWELCTFSNLQRSAIKRGVVTDGRGQGDNQIWRSPRITPDQVPKMAAEIEEDFLEIGQVMKGEEFEVFTEGFTMSKVFYIRGEETRPILKNAAASLSPSTDIAPTFEARVSVPMSALAGMSSSFQDPLIAREIGSCMTRVQIETAAVGDRYDLGMSVEELRLACAVPNVVGGYAIPPLSSFLWRGFSDPLVASIASAIADDVGVGLIVEAIAEEVEVDVSHLIDDPHSIPLSRPTAARNAGNRGVADTVRNSARVPAFREVFDYSLGHRDDIKKRLVELMRTTESASPTVCHELMKATRPGMADRLIARFKSTLVFRRMAAQNGVDLFNIGLSADRELATWLVERGSRLGRRSNNTATAYELACRGRAKWNLGVEIGTSACPLDGYLVEGLEDSECVLAELRDTSDILRYYRGTRTEARMERGVERAVVDTSVTKDVRLLMTMRSQVHPVGGLARAFDDIIASRALEGRQAIEHLFPVVVGGSVAHRLDLHERTKYSLSCAPCWPSRTLLNTDLLIERDGDFAVPVQEYMLCLSAFVSIRARAGITTGCVSLVAPTKCMPAVDAVSDDGGKWAGYTSIPTSNMFLQVARIDRTELADMDLTDIGRPSTRPRDAYTVVLARLLGQLGGPGMLRRLEFGLSYAGERLDKAEVLGAGASEIARAVVTASIIMAFAFLLPQDDSSTANVPLALSRATYASLQLIGPHIFEAEDSDDYLESIGATGGIVGESDMLMLGRGLASRALAVLERKAPPLAPLPLLDGCVTTVVARRLALAWAAASDFRDGGMSVRRLASIRAGMEWPTMAWSPHLVMMHRWLKEGTGIEIVRYSVGESLRWLRGRRVARPPGKQWPNGHKEIRRTTPGSGIVVIPGNVRQKTSGRAMTQMRRAAIVSGGLNTSGGVELFDALSPGDGIALDVGFGSGGSAASLIMAGHSVIGIDLRATIPREPGALVNWAPNEVRARGLAKSFAVSKHVFSKGGDWWKCGAEAINRADPAVINLGIELGAADTPLRVYGPLIEACWIGRLYSRVVGTKTLVRQHISVLEANGGRVTVHAPAVFDGSGAVILEAHLPMPMRHLMVHTLLPDVDLRERSSPLTLGGTREALVRRALTTAFGVGLPIAGMSLNDAAISVAGSVNAARANTYSYIPLTRLIKARRDLATYREAVQVVHELQQGQAGGSVTSGKMAKLIGLIFAISKKTGVLPDNCVYIAP